jgi:hypothetical protein
MASLQDLLQRRAVVPFEGEAAPLHPVRDREARGAPPRLQFRGLVAPVLRELGAQAHRAARDRVVAEHHLVLPLEDVVADDVRLDDLEAQLFLHFACHAGPRVLPRLEVAGDEREPAFGPALAAREDDLAVVLDERADRRRGIAPVDVPAGLGGTGEAVYEAAVIGDGTLDEGAGATGAVAEFHAGIFACVGHASAPRIAR